jgi:hypothetical protein
MTHYYLNQSECAGGVADECRKEVAAILARGVLRLVPTNFCRTHRAKNSPVSGPEPIEVSDETVLSVHTG